MPPAGTSNQSNIPDAASACKCAEEPEHMVTFAAVGVGGVGITLAGTVIGKLVQPFLIPIK